MYGTRHTVLISTQHKKIILLYFNNEIRLFRHKTVKSCHYQIAPATLTGLIDGAITDSERVV